MVTHHLDHLLKTDEHQFVHSSADSDGNLGTTHDV